MAIFMTKRLLSVKVPLVKDIYGYIMRKLECLEEGNLKWTR